MADEETYRVQLVFETPAADHQKAVLKVVEELARGGIMNWTYRATRLSDGAEDYFDGDGDRVNLEPIREQLRDEGLLREQQ